MHVIIPAGRIAQDLLDLTLRYLSLHNNPLLSQPLTERKQAYLNKVAKAEQALQAHRQMVAQCQVANLEAPKFTGYTAEDIRSWRPVSDQFTLSDALQIVQAMVEDFLNYQMHWTRQATCDALTNQRLAVLFPYWDDERAVKAAQHYHTAVLEQIFDTVGQVVQQFVPNKTWTMWYVSKYGRDMTIERGEDYRVLDWQRRMDSGEWTMSSIPPNPATSEGEDFEAANAHALAGTNNAYHLDLMRSFLRTVRPRADVKGHGVPKVQREDVTILVDPDPREVPKVIFSELPEGFSMEGYRA